MANIKSAKKRILQNLKRYEFNKFRKSKIRSSIKKVHNLVTDKNKKEAQMNLNPNYQKLLEKVFIKKTLLLGWFQGFQKKLKLLANFFFFRY